MCPKYYDPQLVRKGSVDFTDSGERQTEYTYNADGALSGDANRGIAKIDYDACGYPRRVQFMDGSVTEYVYTVTGVKLRTVHRTAVPGISVAFGQTRELTEGETLSADSTDYLGNLILEDGVPSEYLFDGGYCSFDGDGISYHYYDRDHQGNIRAVVNSDGTVEQIMNYYPFGAPFSDNTAMNPDLQPYKYNGKEFEAMHGRHAYDYGARFYDPLLQTWDRMDPLCEKYYHVSPYAYCANDPVNFIDLRGDSLTLNGQLSDLIEALDVPGNELEGFYNFGIDGNGLVQMTPIAGADLSKMSERQRVYSKALDRVINGTDGMTTVNVENGSMVIIGDARKQAIDIGDIRNMGDYDDVNSATVFLHEIYEQYLIQVGKSSIKMAHINASGLERNVTKTYISPRDRLIYDDCLELKVINDNNEVIRKIYYGIKNNNIIGRI